MRECDSLYGAVRPQGGIKKLNKGRRGLRCAMFSALRLVRVGAPRRGGSPVASGCHSRATVAEFGAWRVLGAFEVRGGAPPGKRCGKTARGALGRIPRGGQTPGIGKLLAKLASSSSAHA